MTTIAAPTFAHFPGGSIVLVATIRDGVARVVNECGEWWDEPADRLTPATSGVTW